MKSILSITLVLLLLLFTGCGKIPNLKIGGSSGTTSTPDDLCTWTDGLHIEFDNNMPPSETEASLNFPVKVILKNAGCDNIDAGDGVLLIRACREVDLSESKSFSLDGRSMYLPEGESRSFYFTASSSAGQDSCPITAQACYRYMSKLDQTVCINPLLDSPETSNIGCEIEQMNPKGQGGPVVVSKIDESIYKKEDNSSEVMFKIYVKNVGEGQVVDPASFNMLCSDYYDESLANKVRIFTYLGGTMIPGSCESEAIILTENNENNYVICRFRVDTEQGPFTSVLFIELNYGYSELETKSIKILGNKSTDQITIEELSTCGGNPTDEDYNVELLRLSKNPVYGTQQMQLSLIEAVIKRESHGYQCYSEEFTPRSGNCCSDDYSTHNTRPCQVGDTVTDCFKSYGIMQVNLKAHPELNAIEIRTDWAKNMVEGVNILKQAQSRLLPADKRCGSWGKFGCEAETVNGTSLPEVKQLYKHNAIALRYYNGWSCNGGDREYVEHVKDECTGDCGIEFIDCLKSSDPDCYNCFAIPQP